MKRRFNPNLGPRPRCFEEGSAKLQRLRYLESLSYIKGDKQKVWERERLRAEWHDCQQRKKMWDRNEELRQTSMDDYICNECGQHCGPSDLYHPGGHCLKTPD